MSNLNRILVGGAIGLAIMLVLFIFIAYRSSYSGVEFSPDDFTARSFSYTKVPWIDLVIRGRQYDDYYLGGMDLVGDGLVKPKYQTPQTWHLVNENSGYQRLPSRDCDARFLVDHMELMTKRGEYVWGIWNSDYPKPAKVFWPVVAEMARDEMYLVIGDVLEFGIESTTKDEKQFASDLNEVVSKAYLKLAEVEAGVQNYARAKLLAEKSNRFLKNDEADLLLKTIENEANEP